MFKRITLLCALLAVMAYPAYAEVQNIKVSGDITAAAVYRNNFDLEDKFFTDAAGWGNQEDQDSFFQSVVRLRVDADLTDNVAATVRLANMREWDTIDGTADYEDINIDLANITLKEMLYSPLTVIIGRQELHYGQGLVVGYGLYQDPGGNLKYDDLSSMHGYDAVRAILDYDPWTLDLVYAKMYEQDDVDTTTNRSSDIDLMGANLGYKFADYDAEMEAYWFYKDDPAYDLAIDVAGSDSDERTFVENYVHTVGLRGSLVPRENLTLSGEISGQLGEIISETDGATTGRLERDRQGLAANVAGMYKLADLRFVPTLGVEYLYLSGEEYNNNGDFEAWDPMYRGKRTSNIRESLESLFATNDPADTSGFTNQHTLKASGSMDLGELVDGLSLDLAYLHYWFDEEPIEGSKDDIGDEVNLKLTYDYTEDVEFALYGDIFIPGDYYDAVHTEQVFTTGGMSLSAQSATNRVANDPVVSVIGSCKVSF